MLSKTEKERIQKEVGSILKNPNMSSEYMAVKLGVKNGTILNWVAGRRTPKKPTVQLIEQFWHVRILDR